MYRYCSRPQYQYMHAQQLEDAVMGNKRIDKQAWLSLLSEFVMYITFMVVDMTFLHLWGGAALLISAAMAASIADLWLQGSLAYFGQSLAVKLAHQHVRA